MTYKQAYNRLAWNTVGASMLLFFLVHILFVFSSRDDISLKIVMPMGVIVSGLLYFMCVFVLGIRKNFLRTTKLQRSWDSQFENPMFLLDQVDHILTCHQRNIIEILWKGRETSDPVLEEEVFLLAGDVPEGVEKFYRELTRMWRMRILDATTLRGFKVFKIHRALIDLAKERAPLQDFQIPDPWTKRDEEVVNAS